jgi:bifunctional DNase/RNase
MRSVIRSAPSIVMRGVAFMLVFGLIAACGQRAGTSPLSPPSGEVRVEVTEVGYDKQSASHYVQLDDRARQRSLQIAIGDDPARAITLELSGVKSPRPLTNQLLGTMLARTGNAVDRVEITQVRDEIYYAKIILNHGRYALDSRPSDAIALAMTVNAPIYVANELMLKTSTTSDAVAAPIVATNLGVTVQALTPDLANYLGIAAGTGAVIADFSAEAGKSGLQRGDVLVEVDGHTIRTPDDFARMTVATGSRIAMTVRRGKTKQTITIAPALTGGASR